MDAKQQIGVVEQAPGPSRLAAASFGLIAILAQLALVDAAVETFWGGSPIRWWVAPSVLVFVALSVWLWRPGGRMARRWGWSGAASWSIGGLLLLLASTAWLPEGQTNGVRMLLQQTSTVLTAASALAVGLAGISLIRLRMLPPWSRYALGALAVYGIASFATGIASAMPYTSLFHGGSLWTRLPFWLQGAFIGGLVVLPAGLVAAVVQQGTRYFHRAGTGGWTLEQPVALALSLVMTLSGVAAPGGSPVRTGSEQTTADRQSGPPSIAPGAEVPFKARLELPPPPPPEPTLEELKASFEELAPRIPEERYDAEARARTLGPGVQPTFSFVRDRIRYEAYSGVLRGAGGTLAARAGNSFDRSLLLAKMLAARGVRTRFVRGDLPRPEADVLFSRIFEGFQPPTGIAASAGEGATPVARFWSRVTTRARRDYTVIRAALGNLLSANAQSSREQAIRDIQQHVWVQAEVDGQWMDLDTSFAAAEPGRAYCPARQTVDEMPPDWQQRVTVRVMQERLEDGAIKTTPALEATLPAVDLVDQEVFLVHVPDAAGRSGLGLGAAGAPQGGDRWAPALSIGGDLEVGRPVAFGDAGETSGFFDALGGGRSSAFVAEWLEFEVLRPDGRRDVTRRTLVDRATAAWRASKDHPQAALQALARDGQGLLGPRAIRNIWFSAGPHNLRGYADVIRDLSAAVPGEPDPKALLDVQLLPLAASNFAALVWADHATVPAVNDLPQVRLYSDSPRIIIVSVTPDAKGGVVEEYDLRRDWLCGLARDASADGLVVDRKVWFAALEGALEHEAVARDLAVAGNDASTVVSTSGLLTPAGVVVLGPSDLERLSQMTGDPEKVARLDATIRGGHLLVVPRAGLATGSAGWWEVAPNGDARAVVGNDLNMSKGGINFNSYGGAKSTATRWGTSVIKDPVRPDSWAKNFGKVRPRPPLQKKKMGSFEYTALLVAVALSTITGVQYYQAQQRLKAYEVAVITELSDSGK